MAGEKWNDEKDRQLLMAIIHLTDAPRPDWSTVATMMGDAYTKESVRQHFQKLQKEVKAQYGDAGTAAGGDTPNKSPTKSKAKTPKSTTKKPAAKKRKVEEADMDDVEESPSKSAAAAPIKDVKEEGEDGEQD
ncbi:hypothetical protein MBLNU230_g2116t1 [Neophaeotheca triangularis]